jgi:hypothetical protein
MFSYDRMDEIIYVILSIMIPEVKLDKICAGLSNPVTFDSIILKAWSKKMYSNWVNLKKFQFQAKKELLFDIDQTLKLYVFIKMSHSHNLVVL